MNFGQKYITIEYKIDNKIVKIHGKGNNEKEFARRNNIELPENTEEKSNKKRGRKSKNAD